MSESCSQFVKSPTSKRIVLFSPKTDFNYYFNGVPLSLLAISRFLYEEGGYDIKIISASPKEDYIQTILQLSDGAICFGVTSMTGYQIYDGLRAAKAVKEKYPNIPIVWGGWHPSICSTQTVSNPNVDIVVRGQGERTFTELVHKLQDHLPLNDVLGITYKQDGKVFHNADRLFEDINNFPALPYHLIDVEEYFRRMGSRTLYYVSSYGCPHRCGFCAELTVNKRRWSGLKAERVIDELQSIVAKYNVDSIIFADSNFFVNERRVCLICERIIDRKLNIEWRYANGRLDQLMHYNEDTWRLMRDSGCESILIGAESGSQEALDLINKDATVEDTIEFTKISKSYGIKIIFSFMLGFPPRSEKLNQAIDEEFRQTVNLIDKIKSIYDNVQILCFIYTPYPGTPLYDLSIEHGLKEPDTLEDWSHFDLLAKNTPWVPDKHVKLIQQLIKYIFPFVFKQVDYSRLLNKSIPVKFFNQSLLEILHRMASFRWKHKFFSIPIEYQITRFLWRLFRGD